MSFVSSFVGTMAGGGGVGDAGRAGAALGGILSEFSAVLAFLDQTILVAVVWSLTSRCKGGWMLRCGCHRCCLLQDVGNCRPIDYTPRSIPPGFTRVFEMERASVKISRLQPLSFT